MGENGAGKSTLIKAITGALPLDDGRSALDGDVRATSAPRTTRSGAGISTVYQEIDLLPNLSVAENIALGREPRRFGVIDWRRMRRARARACSRDLGLDIDPASLLGTPLARRAAAGRDRAGDLDRRAGARARRADLEPRRSTRSPSCSA